VLAVPAANKGAMPRDLLSRGLRAVGVAAAVFGALVAAGFFLFVVISWGVLREALGTGQLILVLMMVAVTAGTWGSIVVRWCCRPRSSPLGRWGRAGVALVSLLAVVCAGVVVPATRDRLEGNKCRRIAPADAGGQARCHEWLEGRRQWWTLGLSHKNG
ncbi:MAG: hypothetical protein LC792_08790, partial [Actinobacteria bacterium]|nr:hypothetical protein [Actinomycetota bacterium]